MDLDRALELGARLALAYPGRQVDEGHIFSWAQELAQYDDDVAAEAVDRLRTNLPHPPAAAQVINELEDVYASHRPALTEGTLFYGEPVPMPDDVRQKIDEMQAEWADDERRSPVEETAEWEAKRQAIMAGPKVKSPCADVVGQETFEKDGHVYCPSCGEDLCRECPPGHRVEVGA